MFTRMTILGLAAFASITAAIVSPTTASAMGGGRHFGGGFGGFHFGGGHFGGRRFGGDFGGRRFGGDFGGRRFGGMHSGRRFGHNSRWSHRDWRYSSRWYRYDRLPPVAFGVPDAGMTGGMAGGNAAGGAGQGGGSAKGRGAGSGGGPARGLLKPVSSRPEPENCLSKQYMPDGTALFQDLCTGEEAVTDQDQAQEQPAQLPPGSARRLRR